MILEHAVLAVRPGTGAAFEAAFAQARELIARAEGYGGLSLTRCVERPDTYLLLVRWRTLTDHTDGFRGSGDYAQWRTLLHDFYEPFPTVEHFVTELGDEVLDPTAQS